MDESEKAKFRRLPGVSCAVEHLASFGKNILLATAIAILLLAAWMKAHAATSSPGVPRPEEMSDLLKTYRAWGLPLPPQKAELVFFDYGQTVDANGKGEPISHLAFVLKAGTSNEPPLLLVGTLEYRPQDKGIDVRPADAEKVNAKNVSPEWMGRALGINAGLATAVQCEARGYHHLAATLFAASLAKDSGHNYGAFYQPANLAPKTALACMAWAHWANELVLTNSDRSDIARRMQDLLDAEPKLRTEPNTNLLKDLKAALVPSQAKSGSVESFIDGLVELAFTQPYRSDEVPPPEYQKLVLLGFKAVPDLIQHLDDRRLTRSAQQGFNNFAPCHLRVGDFVSDLLQGLAGEDLGKDWLRRQQGYVLDKGPVEAWWAKAQAIGEEEYLTKHVLPEGSGGFLLPQMLDIIAQKYPSRLPALYRELLDQKPNLQSWPLAQAIGSSMLPREEKVSLFLYATTNQNLEHRRAALWELKKLDNERFVGILVENLNAVPPTPKGAYWQCREAALANLVMETDDPRAWQALLAAARRADVGLRMEFMNPMDYAYIGEQQRTRRLAFVAAFLNDEAVRDEKSNPDKFSGPFAGFTFPKLEVRNFAAMEIASILDFPDEPKPDWSSSQWAALRRKVQAALKRELK